MNDKSSSLAFNYAHLLDEQELEYRLSSITNLDKRNTNFRATVCSLLHECFTEVTDSEDAKRCYRLRRSIIAKILRISDKSIDRWYTRYKQGEVPTTRYTTRNKCASARNDNIKSKAMEDALVFAVNLRSTNKAPQSVDDIIASFKLINECYRDVDIPRSTLQRKLQERGFGARSVRKQKVLGIYKAHGRYEPEHVMDEVQGDFKDITKVVIDDSGNYIPVHIQVWIDHKSRMVVGYGISTRENNIFALRTLHESFINYGLPRAIHVDNGPAYRSAKFKTVLDNLSIKLIKSIPLAPEGYVQKPIMFKPMV